MDIVGFIEWLIQAPFLCCAWLIIGAIAGALARRVMGSQDEPIWSDLILGLAGAIFGGFVTGSVLGMIRQQRHCEMGRHSGSGHRWRDDSHIHRAFPFG